VTRPAQSRSGYRPAGFGFGGGREAVRLWRMAQNNSSKRTESGLKRIRVKAYSNAVDGKLVKAARVKAGLTQTQAAAALGWPTQRWWDLESARHPNPRIGTLLAVCKVLGCEITDLLRKE
jgi:DNA-binding XRE family transcriptional regulator